MDKPMRDATCWNVQEGCLYVTPATEAAVQHYLNCEYSAIRCVKCNNQVLRRNFPTHLREACRAKSTGTSMHSFDIKREFQNVLHEQRFLQSCVQEATLGIEKVSVTVEEFKQVVRKELRERDAAVKSLFAKQEELVKKAEARSSETERAVLEIKDTLNALLGEVECQGSKHNNIQGDIKTLSSDMAEARAKQEELTQCVKDITKDVFDTKENVRDVLEQSQSLDRKLTAIADEMLVLKEKQSASYDCMINSNQEAELRCADVIKNCAGVKSDILEIINEVQQLGRRLVNIEGHIKRLNADVAETRCKQEETTDNVTAIFAKVCSTEEIVGGAREQKQAMCENIMGIAKDIHRVGEKQGEYYGTLLLIKQAVDDYMAKILENVDGVEYQQERICTHVQVEARTAGETSGKIDDVLVRMDRLRRCAEVTENCTAQHFLMTRLSMFTGPWLGRGVSRVGDKHVLWCIEGVSKYIDTWTPSSEVVYSDTFVGHGYSAQLGYGVTMEESVPHVAFFFRICRGENDSNLKWPFQFFVTFSLIHPRLTFKDVRQKIYTPFHDLQCFTKPESGMNTPCGISTFCTIDQLKKYSFINGDTNYFTLTLE